MMPPAPSSIPTVVSARMTTTASGWLSAATCGWRRIGPGMLVPTLLAVGALHSTRAGAEVDIAAGNLTGITEIARQGIYPDGVSAMSMTSTACNVGTAPIAYRAPMAEEHPVLVMQLYREWGGRFEQIGVSDARHEYFALSSSECSVCQNPTDGMSLGAGCSSTTGIGINGDRTLLGPRGEIDPWTGAWECAGSHFAGSVDDCLRRHGGSGHGSLDHRLTARDQDLGLNGASYFYEMYFIAEEDLNHQNNLGSRSCTMVWTGSHWSMATPAQSMLAGPALARWGGLQSWASIPEDGAVLLASKAIDLGNDRFRYEYALFNLDSQRRVRRLSIPVGTNTVDAIGFHDPDGDASNDWPGSVASGVLTWETDPADVDPSSPGLIYGTLYNFWFESDAPPSPGHATLEAWERTGDDQVLATAEIPSSASGIEHATGSEVRFSVFPNPAPASAELVFVLRERSEVSLAIFDAGGRTVRLLMDGSAEEGSQRVLWDGRDQDGRMVGAGVYYATLQAAGQLITRAITVVR